MAIEDEMTPIYLPIERRYTGIAQGGPKDGQTMSSETLTLFFAKNILDPTTRRPVSSLSLNVRLQIEDEKEKMERNKVARMTPHRYDYDIEKRVWNYVDYVLSPVDGE